MSPAKKRTPRAFRFALSVSIDHFHRTDTHQHHHTFLSLPFSLFLQQFITVILLQTPASVVQCLSFIPRQTKLARERERERLIKMMRQDSLPVSSSRRENSKEKKFHAKSIGCMSGLIRFVSGHRSRRKFLTFGTLPTTLCALKP